MGLIDFSEVNAKKLKKDIASEFLTGFSNEALVDEIRKRHLEEKFLDLDPEWPYNPLSMKKIEQRIFCDMTPLGKLLKEYTDKIYSQISAYGDKLAYLRKDIERCEERITACVIECFYGLQWYDWRRIINEKIKLNRNLDREEKERNEKNNDME